MTTTQPSMPTRRRRQDVEQEVASRMASLMTREFGLTPTETSAALGDGILRVKMEDALSHMARVVAKSPEGPQILNSVYTLLHDACQTQMHYLISRIIGRSVWRSEIKIDVYSGDVFVTFDLGA